MPLAVTNLTQYQILKLVTMDNSSYSVPSGVHTIPEDQLDLRSDNEIDALLQAPPPVPHGHERNVWFFWHSGYSTMHPYAKRTVRAYHRRLASLGWTIRVLDVTPDSPGNVANFLDISDPALFPRAFRDNTITGTYARQHTSDLVRFPLLLRYGGVYADVGLMLIGDLDRLWNSTIGNPDSPYKVVSFNDSGKDEDGYNLFNYFLCAGKNNALFQRCHQLLLALWAEDGGKTNTEGMHRSSLLQGLSLLKSSSEDSDKLQVELSDYIIQGQAIRMAMGSVDEEDGWNGPEYVTKHVYVMDYMVGSQLINEMTSWDGPRAFELMSLRLPEEGREESSDQKLAREIVEACLSKSFAFKLAHGLILAVLGETLGSLWRSHDGSDDIQGTYAHWLRYGMVHWTQDKLPPSTPFRPITPYKTGRLLKGS
ncbi:hypothetical protein N0V93_009239 [Gnomoniopsis smithogilvyi]|uniref:Capsule polysaccharide biosynthesis protein n=1 Tax=Gnomoniopsis smithogilvyi TaxID=1191159 RepID=A0A9W8YJA2_9PEZI|nr:hypothetical protein N0V93_009239 [Gnomoniopsis smithogilvyi]